jgi:hypothetical protein
MTDAPSAYVLLGYVIATADTVLNRRGHVTRADFENTMALLRARHEKPSEHPRRTHFALMLMKVIGNILVADPGDAAKWRMIAGCILPCVQDDVGRAREDERAQMADTR